MQDLIHRLADHFKSAISATLSTCSGSQWSVVAESGSEPNSPLWKAIALEGVVSGNMYLGFEPAVGAALSQALLQLPEASSVYGKEEIEATDELLRQVCGEFVTKLRGTLGETTFRVLDHEGPPSSVSTRTLNLQRKGFSGVIQLAFGPELAAKDKAEAARVKEPLAAHQSARNLELLLDVQLFARVRFGSRKMKLRDLLQTQPGAVIELDRLVHEPVDLLVDSKLVARGEVVIVEGNYGFRVKQVLNTAQRATLIV